eukprot:5778936-Amphidinium_carterae.2
MHQFILDLASGTTRAERPFSRSSGAPRRGLLSPLTAGRAGQLQGTYGWWACPGPPEPPKKLNGMTVSAAPVSKLNWCQLPCSFCT